jgi:uncharacterized protein (TIGR02145 family)
MLSDNSHYPFCGYSKFCGKIEKMIIKLITMFTFLNKRGFTAVGILVIVLLLILAGGILIWHFWPNIPRTPSSTPMATSSPTPLPSSSPGETTEKVWSCGDTLSYQGKDYNTVKIGDQCWFAENLDYDNGCSQIAWINNSDEGWCGYHDGTDYGEGLLYQWSAAMDSTITEEAQGLCPDGWHIPSDAEWMILEEFLGMCSGEGTGCSGDLGSRGTNQGSSMAANSALWADGDLKNDANSGSSGLDILPTACRRTDGSYYYNRGEFALLWSSTKIDDYVAFRGLRYPYTRVWRQGDHEANGFSVRCVKN